MGDRTATMPSTSEMKRAWMEGCHLQRQESSAHAASESESLDEHRRQHVRCVLAREAHQLEDLTRAVVQ